MNEPHARTRADIGEEKIVIIPTNETLASISRV